MTKCVAFNHHSIQLNVSFLSATVVIFTLPETNSSPLKIGHPKRKVAFQPFIFRGENASFRECSMDRFHFGQNSNLGSQPKAQGSQPKAGASWKKNPPKMNECPLKKGPSQKDISSSSHYFLRGHVGNFRGHFEPKVMEVWFR